MTSLRQPELIKYMNELLPPAAEHLPLIYHTSRTRSPIDEVVLSITPTQGLYSGLKSSSAVFLHRPWGLDRSRLFPSTVVLSSHQRLDELLTTGWNKALLSRLGVDEPYSDITGYKQDPERRMGLVGSASGSLINWVDRIEAEFGGKEGVVGVEEDKEIKALACMNAFDGPIVQRVLEAAKTDLNAEPHEVLYLTGETRKDGLELAEQLNMPVFFAGHRRAELWAINYIAHSLQERWPGLHTRVIDEPEELRDNQKRKSGNVKSTKPPDQQSAQPGDIK